MTVRRLAGRDRHVVPPPPRDQPQAANQPPGDESSRGGAQRQPPARPGQSPAACPAARAPRPTIRPQEFRLSQAATLRRRCGAGRERPRRSSRLRVPVWPRQCHG
jgi:hypothetical protein